jgi:hypothetical protein
MKGRIIYYREIINLKKNLEFIKLFNCLIAISQTAHTGHDAEDVVVDGVHTDFGRVSTKTAVADSEDSGVNARHVEGTRGLVFFGFESEGVHVDTFGERDVFVVLVRLNEGEVWALAFFKSVVTIELEESRGT